MLSIKLKGSVVESVLIWPYYGFIYRLNTRIDLNLTKVTRIDLQNTRIDLAEKLTRMNLTYYENTRIDLCLYALGRSTRTQRQSPARPLLFTLMFIFHYHQATSLPAHPNGPPIVHVCSLSIHNASYQFTFREPLPWNLQGSKISTAQ